MGLLGRNDDAPPPRRFQMRQKLIAVGDDYWIEDEHGDKAFKVNGKAMRVRDTFILEDLHGQEVATIKEHKLTVRDTMAIDLADGSATVKKALVGLRDRFNVEVDHGHDLKVHGNIVDHEYEIEDDGNTVAHVSKKWFRLRDTYGVEIEAGVDPVLVLAITVAVDSMTRL